MATKTKLIVLFRERRIKYRWIFLRQESEILAAVGDMTSTAIIVLDGTVKEFLVFDFFSESGQNFIFVYLLRFIMTSHANLSRLTFQYEFNG